MMNLILFFTLEDFLEIYSVKDSNIFVLKKDNSKGYVKDYDWEGYMNALYDKEIRFYEELKQNSLKYLHQTLRFKYLSEIESLENRITRIVRKNKKYSKYKWFETISYILF